jgi:hypothetical protein
MKGVVKAMVRRLLRRPPPLPAEPPPDPHAETRAYLARNRERLLREPAVKRELDVSKG